MKLRKIIKLTENHADEAMEKLGEEQYASFKLFDRELLFAGIAVQEGNFQFSFLPVGSEIWIDDDTNTIASFYSARQSFSFSTGDVPELSEGVGV